MPAASYLLGIQLLMPALAVPQFSKSRLYTLLSFPASTRTSFWFFVMPKTSNFFNKSHSIICFRSPSNVCLNLQLIICLRVIRLSSLLLLLSLIVVKLLPTDSQT